jgi:DNA-binding YbaB/EbfC family protein
MNNMQQFLARAQKMQAKLMEVQSALEGIEVKGTSGSGLVSVIMNGKGVVKSITIDKEVINPEEKDILEDLILAAFTDAKVKADAIHEEEMKKATGGMSLPGM